MESENKIWSTFGPQDDFEIISYSPKYHDQAMSVFHAGFVRNERVCSSIGLYKPESVESAKEMQLFVEELVKDGVSLLTRYIPADKIVGAAFNKIQILDVNASGPSFFEIFRDEKCKTEKAKFVMDFMIKVDSKVNVFEKFNVDCGIELTFLTTHPNFTKRSIGKKLCEATLEMTKFRKNCTDTTAKEPQMVMAMWTSPISHRIGTQLEFTELYHCPYSEFIFQERKLCDWMGDENAKAVLAAKLV